MKSGQVRIFITGKDGVEHELSENLESVDLSSGNVETTVYKAKRPATITFSAAKPLNRYWQIVLNTIAIWKRK